MKRIFFFVLGMVSGLFSACHRTDIPADVERILSTVSPNRNELEKAIDHYAGSPLDSLKLKALYVLLRSLEGRSYFDSEMIDNYMDYGALVLRDLDHGEYIMESLGQLYGPYQLDKADRKTDLGTVTARQLISNVDAAFKVWRERPWGKDYDFDQFCQYILPFRIADEVPCYDRAAIGREYERLLDTLDRAGSSAQKACVMINKHLFDKGWVLTSRASFLPHSRASRILEYRIGACREMVDMGIYVMRSVGIPVTSDFLPQWPYRKQGHSWNVLIAKDGSAVPFLAAEDDPGKPHKPGTKKGKVYRNTLMADPGSLAKLAGPGDVIPKFLKDPFIRDVTDEYATTHTVALTWKERERFAYLAVFNNVDWQPVCWADTKGGTARFAKVEGGIVFLPSKFTADGVVPAGLPFLLTEQGQKKELVPDSLHMIPAMYCDRVYPVLPESFLVDKVIGGWIEGANERDFSDACDLTGLLDKALPAWNELPLASRGKFRYFRFRSSRGNRCALAELQFFASGRKLNGHLFSDNFLSASVFRNADDNNILTAYEPDTDYSWLGFDAGSPVAADQVKFVCKVDRDEGHLIRSEQKYRLQMWSGNEWVTVAVAAAAKGQAGLRFSQIPANALYKLAADIDGYEARIFTYENGKQVWW